VIVARDQLVSQPCSLDSESAAWICSQALLPSHHLDIADYGALHPVGQCLVWQTLMAILRKPSILEGSKDLTTKPASKSSTLSIEFHC
jgi:hypothetical protein